MRKPPKTLRDIFWTKVAKSDNCWEWQGRIKHDGYGTVTVLGTAFFAHRLAYELFVGPIPPNLLICHHCDNRRCVRPDHLFVGTQQDNSRDMVKKGRHHVNKQWRTGRCKNGHDITSPDNVYMDKWGNETRRSCRQCKLDKDRARYAAHPERWAEQSKARRQKVS